jgi:hypothetical protein
VRRFLNYYFGGHEWDGHSSCPLILGNRDYNKKSRIGKTRICFMNISNATCLPVKIFVRWSASSDTRILADDRKKIKWLPKRRGHIIVILTWAWKNMAGKITVTQRSL